jgi:integrase
MRGQVTKRGEKTYQVRIFLGRDPVTGKQKFHYKTIHGKKSDAETYCNAKIREIEMGEYLPPGDATFADAASKWLARHKPNVSGRTHGDYVEMFTRNILPQFGNRLLADIKPDEIKDWLDGLYGGGMAARTRRLLLTLVRAVYRDAVHDRRVKLNPAEKVKAPRKKAHNSAIVFKPEEARRFLEHAKASPHDIIYRFALETGMRPEEYLALDWQAVDLEARKVSVRRVIVWKRPSGWEFSEKLKTAKSRRTIEISARLADELRQHKQLVGQLKLHADNWIEHGLVFPSQKGTPHHRDNLGARWFKTILKRAGLNPAMRLYDLRHSFATLSLEANVNPKTVSEWMGHSSVAFTLDTYAHLLPGWFAKASETISRLLEPES